MFDVITIGDCTEDIFLTPGGLGVKYEMSSGRTHAPVLCFGRGEKVAVEDVYYDIGGSACNSAVGLARLGFKTAIVAAAGKDEKADKIRQMLSKEFFSTNYLKIIKSMETSFSIVLAYQGERTILIFRGLKDYAQLQVPNVQTKWLYIGPLGHNFAKIYQQAISLACEKNIKIAVNPGGLQIEKGADALSPILRVASILFVNKEEAEQLTHLSGYHEVKDLLICLKNLGPEIVAITDGKKGAYCFDGDQMFKSDIFPAQRKEATGAGDAFACGFLAAILEGLPIIDALKWGIVNSAFVVEEVGAQTKLRTKRQIIKVLQTTHFTVLKV